MQSYFLFMIYPVQTESHCANSPGWPKWQELQLLAKVLKISSNSSVHEIIGIELKFLLLGNPSKKKLLWCQVHWCQPPFQAVATLWYESTAHPWEVYPAFRKRWWRPRWHIVCLVLGAFLIMVWHGTVSWYGIMMVWYHGMWYHGMWYGNF